jgi:8-oxo-dGTP diphosphatase
MSRYVVGFIFNKDLTQVLLIHKNRPEWQAGKLNGPGGKIEEGENGTKAVRREIEEETGLKTDNSDWYYVKTLSDYNEVDVFTCKYSGNQSDASTMTDEKIGWFDINNYTHETLYNIPELVLLCKEKLSN